MAANNGCDPSAALRTMQCHAASEGYDRRPTSCMRRVLTPGSVTSCAHLQAVSVCRLRLLRRWLLARRRWQRHVRYAQRSHAGARAVEVEQDAWLYRQMISRLAVVAEGMQPALPLQNQVSEGRTSSALPATCRRCVPRERTWAGSQPRRRRCGLQPAACVSRPPSRPAVAATPAPLLTHRC